MLDDKEHAEQFKGFVRAAALADPLTRMDGKKTKIGDHISINSTPDRYHMVVWKNVPARALRMLATNLRKHIATLPRMAHVELFQEVNSQYKIIMSAKRLKHATINEIAREILSYLKHKKSGHYIHFVLLQTVPGGHLMKYSGHY